MRIGIDARFFGSLGKGLGRYTQQLILHLEKSGSDHEFFVLIRPENEKEYIPASPKFHKVVVDIPWYGIKEQIQLPKVLNALQLDVVHFCHFNVPFFYKKPFVVTIHDLILFHYPTHKASTRSAWWYWLKYLGYRGVISHAIRHARAVLTVSQYTKQQIQHHFPGISVPLVVTPQAPFTSMKNSSGETRKIPYFLYVGNAYPHKNLSFALRAFMLWKKRASCTAQFLLVGSPDFFYNRIQEEVQGESDIVFLGQVTDEALQTLYAQAIAYVCPSLEEGFGLPGLEALAQKTLVISSWTSALPEVLENAAYYINPYNLSDLIAAFDWAMAISESEKELWIQRGMKVLAKRQWQPCARVTLQTYEDVYARG